jgi:alpha-glucosidase
MMREINHYLHAHDQHQILMVDPAVAYQNYGPYERGAADDIFLHHQNGSFWLGVVWPGVTVFPDWFNTNTQKYWDNEFAKMFDPKSGVDIDGLWIDMNEPSNFPCNFPCSDPYAAAANGFPPPPPPVQAPLRAIPGFSCAFQPAGTPCTNYTETGLSSTAFTSNTSTFPTMIDGPPVYPSTGPEMGLAGRDYLYPKYAIHNAAAWNYSANAAAGGISNHTVNTDVVHKNGLVMYDTHNLYGTSK